MPRRSPSDGASGQPPLFLVLTALRAHCASACVNRLSADSSVTHPSALVLRTFAGIFLMPVRFGGSVQIDNATIVESTSMTKFKILRVLGGWLGYQRR
jgi:hypothetical protein